jgi:hypothetical protein
VGRQANPKGLDLGLALDYPGRAFSHSGGKFASLAAGHRAGDRVGPERSHAARKSTSTLTASSRVGSYPPEEPPRTRSRRGMPKHAVSTISRNRDQRSLFALALCQRLCEELRGA